MSLEQQNKATQTSAGDNESDQVPKQLDRDSDNENQTVAKLNSNSTSTEATEEDDGSDCGIDADVDVEADADDNQGSANEDAGGNESESDSGTGSGSDSDTPVQLVPEQPQDQDQTQAQSQTPSQSDDQAEPQSPPPPPSSPQSKSPPQSPPQPQQQPQLPTERRVSAPEPPLQPKKQRGRPSSCVFVASLSAAHSDDQLCNSVQTHFQQWGTITLVKVLRDSNNRPYAFVQYSNDEDAAAALAGAQHSTLNDRIIRVEPARVNRTLYVTPLRDSLADEKAVYEFLSQFGEVEQLVHTKVPLGTYKKPNNWYVKFAYRDDAIRAFASLRIDNNWSAEWAQNLDTPGRGGQGAIDKQSIFIGQLDHRVTEEKIIERFSTHGNIVECNVIIRDYSNIGGSGSGSGSGKNNNNNTSFAFVKFDSEQAAAEAVEQENHTVFLDKTMHVQYRELNHHNQQHKNSSEFKLNLAPPPISLPKFDGPHQQNQPQSRINARHSSMPVTPIPSSSTYRKIAPQFLSKWRVNSMRQAYNSPNTSTQAQHGSSPYSSPTPTTMSPASTASTNRQSPQSTVSSATSSSKIYQWKSSPQSSTAIYSPPHKREGYQPRSFAAASATPIKSNHLANITNTTTTNAFQAKSFDNLTPFVPRSFVPGNGTTSSVDTAAAQMPPLHADQQHQPQQYQPQPPRQQQRAAAQLPQTQQAQMAGQYHAPPQHQQQQQPPHQLENYYPPVPIMSVPPPHAPQYFPYDNCQPPPPPPPTAYYYGYHYPVPVPANSGSANAGAANK